VLLLKGKKMDINEYQELTTRTAGNYKQKERALLNWGLGVAGEAGDIAGCIKKTIFHDNDQSEGIKENIGDTMWYLAMICNTMGWKLEDIMEANIAKLKKRYPKGFNLVDARRGKTRVDWMEKGK
jgi:NTP pyrophosphatase (non-canonical NTP hydrolase)